MFYTIPTLLTWSRIVAIPLVLVIYYLPFLSREWQNILATASFFFIAATDWLDGYLARKLQQTSSFGAFLDPVADKFLVAAALLILLQLGRVDAFICLIIIGREIAVSALREWMAQLGASGSVAVHMVGKLKTMVQMAAIVLLLFDGPIFGLFHSAKWGYWLILLAALLTLWSMVYYLRQAIPIIRRHAK